MPVIGFVTVNLSIRRTALEPVTHSLRSFTKVEKIPAGRVVKLHPLIVLVDTTNSNDNENGGPFTPKTLKTKINPRHDELHAGQAAVLARFAYSVRR